MRVSPGDSCDRRLGRSSPAGRFHNPRGRHASCPTANRKLGVRVRQRQPGAVHPAGGDGHLPGARLRAVGQRGVPEPPRPQLRATARLVPARDARVGIELHGGGRPAPHGAGAALRRLQVSARAHVAGRRVSPLDDAGHGLHRPDPALGSRTRTGDSASARRSPAASRSWVCSSSRSSSVARSSPARR